MMTGQEQVDYLAAMVMGVAPGDEDIVTATWIGGPWEGPDRKVRVYAGAVIWVGTARDWRAALCRCGV